MKHSLNHLLALVILLASPFICLAEDRALLVGVGEYLLPDADLPGIDLDLENMRKAARFLGFKPGQVKALLNREATLANVRRAIEDWLIGGAGPEDKVLFYFSGHGSQVRDLDGDEPDGVDEVLMTHDAAVKDGTLINVLVDDEFSRLLGLIPARVALVFIDACHSGSATRTFRGVPKTGAKAGGKVFYRKGYHYPGMPKARMRGGFIKFRDFGPANHLCLSAAQDNEQAVGTEEGGLFTLGLLRALAQSAEKDKNLTFKELRALTEGYIAAQTSADEAGHHPVLSGNPALADLNVFKPVLAVAPSASAAGQWAQLENLADAAAYRVELSANQTRFRIGEALTITCRPGAAGYLNVLHAHAGQDEATVLYPNRYRQENRLEAGAAVILPGAGDPYKLLAQPPAGRSLIVVFHTREPFNAYKEGEGSGAAVFRSITRSARHRGLLLNRLSGSYGAGKLVMEVVE
ncbi:MAG: caspase family protein [Thermodesulfobacteriota bacterium]